MLAEAELISAQNKELFNLLSSKRKMLTPQLSEFRDDLKPAALNQTLLGRVSTIDAMRQQEVIASTYETKGFDYCRKCENISDT